MEIKQIQRIITSKAVLKEALLGIGEEFRFCVNYYASVFEFE